MSDKEFWEKFYAERKGTLEPSPFAQFVWEKYKPAGTLVELGCGNGRDSLFFADLKLDVLGIDQCTTTISRLNALQKNNGKFEVADFTALGDIGVFNNIYSRFTLHSVTKDQASATLNWGYHALTKNGLFFIEVRSVNDELYGEGTEVEPDAFVTDHYRRFVRLQDLTSELKSIGFQVKYSEESRGFAVYKTEDPSVIRIVAIK